MDLLEPKKLGPIEAFLVLLAALAVLAWLYILLIGVEPPISGGRS